MRKAAITYAALAALAVFPSQGRAQDAKSADARDNPFLPTPTDDEDRRIAERERMRQVVRESYPEIKALISEAVTASRQQIVEDAKKQAVEAVKQDPAMQMVSAGPAQAAALAVPAAAPIPAGPQAAAPAEYHGARQRTTLPDGAKFVACVNERPLYKDGKDGTRFYLDAPCK